jgi:hypothetical protein
MPRLAGPTDPAADARWPDVKMAIAVIPRRLGHEPR